MSVGSKSRGFSRRRMVLVGLGGMCLALAVGSVAFACTPIVGNTWYSDGAFIKSGPPGSVITAYATTARPNKQFQLVAGTSLEPGHENHACMDVPGALNPAIRISSARGFIPNTTGPLNRPQGEWQICYGELPLNGTMSSTNPVFFTVI